MRKTYGVCFGMLAMGLAVLGAPVSRAQSRLAAGGAGGGNEMAATSAESSSSTPTSSSPADLQQRIEALKMELADLNNQLAAEKDPEPTAPPAQDAQGQGGAALVASATTAAPATAAPMPLANPSMTAPLATAIPHEVSAGPFGKIEVTGILSGIGITEGNHIPGRPAYALGRQ